MTQIRGKHKPVWRYFVVAIPVALGMALYSDFSNSGGCAEQSIKDIALIFMNSLVQAMKIFTLSASVDAKNQNDFIFLTARIIGAFVAFSAIGGVIYRVFRDDINAAWISMRKDHLVIAGFDETGRAFAENCHEDMKISVVVIDPDPDGNVSAVCQRQDFLFVKGNGYETQVLKDAAVGRCRQLVVSSGSDEDNLAIYRAATAMLKDRKGRHPEAVLTIADTRLAENISSNDGFWTDTRTVFETVLFNPAHATAIALMERTPLIDQALRRGQSRVHLVVMGSSQTAIECVLQFLRISPAIGLEKPHIDWFADDKEELTGQLTRRNEALGKLAKQTLAKRKRSVPLSWAVDLCLHQLPEGSDIPNQAGLEMVRDVSGNQLTAVIIAHKHGADNISTALAIRERTARQGIWRAPIYVHVPHKTSLDALLQVQTSSLARDIPDHICHLPVCEKPEDAIEPFGAIEALCQLKSLRGKREELARKIHAAYVALRTKEPDLGDPSSQSDDSMKPWPQLSETYRLSNRRAVDHLPVKIESVGKKVQNVSQPGHIPPEVLENHDLLEALSAIEHDSWRIGRELDGWRYDKKRDKFKKYHPDLIPYAKLPDGTKQFDRDQIETLIKY